MHLGMHPADVGRMTWDDFLMSAALCDQREQQAKRQAAEKE